MRLLWFYHIFQLYFITTIPFCLCSIFIAGSDFDICKTLSTYVIMIYKSAVTDQVRFGTKSKDQVRYKIKLVL